MFKAALFVTSLKLASTPAVAAVCLPNRQGLKPIAVAKTTTKLIAKRTATIVILAVKLRYSHTALHINNATFNVMVGT